MAQATSRAHPRTSRAQSPSSTNHQFGEENPGVKIPLLSFDPDPIDTQYNTYAGTTIHTKIHNTRRPSGCATSDFDELSRVVALLLLHGINPTTSSAPITYTPPCNTFSARASTNFSSPG